MEECAKHNAHIETSSAFDIDIVIALFKKGLFNEKTYVLCNGFKTEEYILKIKEADRYSDAGIMLVA